MHATPSYRIAKPGSQNRIGKLKPGKYSRLGEMLRLYRTVRGQSLREIAPQIGIGHATLMRIEAGQAFDADTLLKLWAWMLAEAKEP